MGFEKCLFKLFELKKISEFFPFFLVTVLPHTFNKRITVYNIDKAEDDPIEFLVNLVNDYFVKNNYILSYFG